MAEALKDKNSELVSKRWAKALMELVLEDESIAKEDVLNDLRNVASIVDSSDELSTVINNPSISTEEKQIVLCKLFQGKVAPLVYNFIFTLNLRKRAGLLSDIAIEFEKELDRVNNVKHVNITSAIELSDEKKDEIKNKIASKLDSNIIVDWGVDKEIIAGLIFNIDETVIDNSVKHKLEDLSKSIMR